jgi:hypothetical protein
MGLTRQDEAGLDLGAVECEVLLHRHRTGRDPGLARATRATKTGSRRRGIVSDV